MMKLAHVVFASAAIFLGLAACASPASDEQEELGTTSQALCMKGMTCTPTKTSSNWWGGTSGGLSVLDPGTSTSSSGSSSGGTTTITCGVPSGSSFTCGGPVVTCDGSIARLTGEPCDMTVRCQTINGTEQCDCVPGCGGGSYSFGGWNPCMYGRTYTCTPWGTCSCS